MAFWGLGETAEGGWLFSEGQEILEGEQSRGRMKEGHSKETRADREYRKTEVRVKEKKMVMHAPWWPLF